eukprot:1161209-Pelagomonas_calceolata.AAC.3
MLLPLNVAQSDLQVDDIELAGYDDHHDEDHMREVTCIFAGCYQTDLARQKKRTARGSSPA